MIFHENRLLADDSHEISYLIFFRKLGKMPQNMSSAAVVIGALRIKRLLTSAILFDLILYVQSTIFQLYRDGLPGLNQY